MKSSGRDTAALAALLGLFGASVLAAIGRGRAALALTLGTLVAIVSALWLAGLVGRFTAPGQGPAARFDRNFGFKAALRYAVVGLLLWGAVRYLPAEVPWLLAGVSTAVAALVAEGVGEAFRERKGRAP